MDDQSIMPFGKYIGKKLEDIPASYHVYFHDNLLKPYNMGDYANYLRSNIAILRQAKAIEESNAK